MTQYIVRKQNPSLQFNLHLLADLSSALVSPLMSGPGDNSPCENYTTLTESWRRIDPSNGPSVSGLHCDSSLQVCHQGPLSGLTLSYLQDGWYRFEGEAGTQLADQRDPQKWESCGTSRVAWLRGDHPSLEQGTVQRTVCVGEITGDCGHDSLTSVRTCPDTRNTAAIFWVYRLARVNVGCHWAYCAYTEADVPS